MANNREIPATEAATRLGMSRERVIRLVQVGRLKGRRDPERGWLVETASLRTNAKQVRTASA